jgi:hypothetical protein
LPPLSELYVYSSHIKTHTGFRYEPVTVTLDDAASGITYTGFTTLPPNSSAVAYPSISPTSADTDNTLSYTFTPGHSAAVTFKGGSILVSGLTDPSLGGYTVNLDGNLVATLNAGNNVTAHDVPLFFMNNLDTTVVHTLIVTCVSEGLVLDSWTIYGPTGSTGFLCVRLYVL